MATAKHIKKKKPVGYFGYAFDAHISPGRRNKYQTQRKTRGWDDSETWNLDLTITRFILPRLRRFEEITIGYPSEITPQEWHILLKKMIVAFEELENRWDFHTQGESTRNDKDHIQYSNKEKVIQEGLEIFAKYYCYLWW